MCVCAPAASLTGAGGKRGLPARIPVAFPAVPLPQPSVTTDKRALVLLGKGFPSRAGGAWLCRGTTKEPGHGSLARTGAFQGWGNLIIQPAMDVAWRHKVSGLLKAWSGERHCLAWHGWE